MNVNLNRIGSRLGYENLAGILAGGFGLIISFLGYGLVAGRQLGDPMPIMLTIQGLIRGNFLYFDRRGPFLHLIFVLFLGVLSVVILSLINNEDAVTADKARRAARIGVAINVVTVALLEIDAVVVAIWYAMAGAISIFASSYVAGRFAGYLTKQS